MAIQYGSPSRPVGRAPLARPVSQTLAQVANQRVNQQLAPQLAAANTQNAGQNAQIRSFANALLGKLQPIAGQVGQDYNQAIQQTGALSNQAAKYLSAANPTGQVANLLSSVNAPPEQQAQLKAQLGQTFGGGAGVLAFTQGTVPGSQLATDKAAAQAQARSYPLIAGLKGQQDLASALGAQSTARQNLLATRPALYQAAAQDITQNNAARAKLAQGAAAQTEKVREFGITRGDKLAAAATTADYKDRALAATNAYRKQQVGQSQQRTDLGYAKVAQTAFEKKADRAATKTYRESYLAHLRAGDGEKVAHDKAMEAAAQERNSISQQNANTSRINARTSRIRANTAANKPPPAPTVHGDRQWDPVSKSWVKAPGLPAKTSTSAHPLTAPESVKFTKSATQIATNARNGGTDSKGVYHKPVGRDQAIEEMRVAGLLRDPRTAKVAMQALNEAYGPAPRTSKVKSAGPFGVQATATP